MPSSSIITILSLVALCTLSFTVVFGSHNILDTLTRDTLAHDSPFSLPKGNIVHKPRALHHARATTPAPASGSNSPQSNPTPSQSAPSTPDANTQASSPAPVSSPSPSSSSQPSPTQDNSSSAPSPSRATSTSPGTSAASASASATPSPSSAPSASSSSSNAQVSSSPGVTSSPVRATSNVFNNPTTSFVNNPVSYTSGQSGSLPPGSTISSGATASAGAASGFFNNKAAVGATFSIIGIVGGLAVIMAVLTIMKRRRRTRSAIEDEEFFEKYPSVDHSEPVPQIPPGFGTGSAAPSVTDFNMSAAPAGAYPDRAVHYGQSNAGAVLNPVDYGIAYPPGAANNNISTPAIRNGNTYEDTESEYSVPSTSHPFADPVNASGPTAAPPVTYPRSIPARVQEMVTTDSYYGPNSAGLGAGGVGYAE